LTGIYHLTSTIPLLSNITIQGKGAGAQTIVQSPPTPHGFAMVANVEEGISNIVVQNLVLDGNIPALIGPERAVAAHIFGVRAHQGGARVRYFVTKNTLHSTFLQAKLVEEAVPHILS